MSNRELEADLTRSAALLRPCRLQTGGPAWRMAEADGWDMSLVVHELSLTVEQRMRQHDAALTQAEEMRAAFVKQYAGSDAAN